MKKSLLITAIVVVIFASLGWSGHRQLGSARTRNADVLSAAREQGLDPSAGELEAQLTAKASRAMASSHATREMRAKEAARKLAIFGNDMDEIGAMSPGSDLERQLKQLEFQEGLADAVEMDSEALNLLVEAIIANGDLTSQSRSNFIMLVGYSLADKSPALAADLLLNSSTRIQGIPQDQFRNILGAALEKWARTDPRMALRWLQDHGKDHSEIIDAQVRAETVGGMAKLDPILAFSTLGEFGLTKNPLALQGIGATATSSQERSAVLAALRDYVANAGSDEERQTAVKSTLSGMGTRLTMGGYDTAVPWLSSAKLSPEEAAGLASGIDASVTKQDTGKWIDWMAARVPADQLPAKVGELMAFWTHDDYRSAGDWLSNAADGPAKDAAVKSFASGVAATDPAIAAQWAQILPAGDERQDLMKSIYAGWKKQDAAAAGKFARDNDLGE